MTFMSRSYLKLCLSFLLIASILSVTGCVATRGGDTLTKELNLDLGKGVSMKLVLIPAGDINKDGLNDILVSNKKGTFVFLKKK